LGSALPVPWIRVQQPSRRGFNIISASKMPRLEDKATLSFGRYLQAIRLEKAISLEVVSKETRIRKDILVMIEEENHDQLPDSVFVKGFIRAYAKAIDADGDEAIHRYNSRLQVFQKIQQSESDLRKSSTKFWPRLMLSIGTLMCLIFLSVFGVSIFLESPPTDKAEQPQTSKQEIKPDKSEALPSPLPSPEIIEEQNKEKKNERNFLLKIVANEKTWMKVIIDDKERKEYSLEAGDNLSLEADSGYNLLIGNAGGVELLLNDSPISLQGKSGQVVNIQIP
jgi:cytoskeletal protein RodZ